MPSYKTEKCLVVGVTPVEQVTDSFKKRSLVVTTDHDTQYPQILSFEVVQAKCDDANLKEIKPGDEITVHWNLQGREYTDKTGKKGVFNSLQFWKLDINRTSAGNNNVNAQGQQQQAAAQQAPDVDFNTMQPPVGDLPF